MTWLWPDCDLTVTWLLADRFQSAEVPAWSGQPAPGVLIAILRLASRYPTGVHKQIASLEPWLIRCLGGLGARLVSFLSWDHRSWWTIEHVWWILRHAVRSIKHIVSTILRGLAYKICSVAHWRTSTKHRTCYVARGTCLFMDHTTCSLVHTT